MATNGYDRLIRDSALIDPTQIQDLVISELETRLAGGNTILDPNNVVSSLIEAFSVLTSGALNSVNRTQHLLYPRRATDMDALFRHMSDYDYLDLYSTPSQTYVIMYLDPQYLIHNGKYDTTNPQLKKVVIPESSVFNIAGMNFGIYYPIDIMINPISKSIGVFWDESVENPLYNLTQNTIEHRMVTHNGVRLLSIKIPVHQFSKTENVEDVSLTAGFVKSYAITDGRFYAVRIWNLTSTGEWEEIHQSLSDIIYDPNRTTALIKVFQEQNKVLVSIPQAYLDKEMVGTRVRVDIYTTRGAIDLTLTTADANNIKANIPVINEYSEILSRIKTMFFTPGATNIVGGENGLSFEDLKTRVITNSFTAGTLITPMELNNYFAAQGYKIAKYQDGITNRIYRCYRVVTDKNGTPLPAATFQTKVRTVALEDYDSTIKQDVDNSVMILPTAIFKYDINQNSTIPLTNDEIVALQSLSGTAKVDELNDNIYTHIPFHLKMSYNGKYPVAYSYDLFEPAIARVEFISENGISPVQASLQISSIEHLNNGTGGYKLTLEIWRSNDLATINPATQMTIVLTSVNALRDPVYIVATYKETRNNRFVFEATLETEYSFSISHRIRLTNFKDRYEDGGHDFPLDMDLNVVCLLDKLTSVDEEPVFNLNDVNLNPMNKVLDDLARLKYPSHVQLSKQTLSLNLGRLLTETDNPVEVVPEPLQYLTYSENVYAVYPRDTYLLDENDIPVWDEVNETLIKTHSQGDWYFAPHNQFKALTADTTAESNILTNVVLEVGAVWATDVVNGMCITLPGIPQYVTVIDHDSVAETITVSMDATDTAAGSEGVIGYPEIQHAAGTPIFNPGESPSDGVQGIRNLTYYVDAIHIDAKFDYSDLPEHETYLEDVVHQLKGYFNTVSIARDRILENTELYFHPIRTLGSAKFNTSNGVEIDNDLGITIYFVLYVPPNIFADETTKRIIYNSALQIVDKHLTSGTIACTKIAANILSDLADSVIHIDVLGIDIDNVQEGQLPKQTLIGKDTSTQPSLKHLLVRNEDMTFSVQRGLYITFNSM